MKTVIELAREAGIPALGDIFLCKEDMERFAALVRADEREQISTEERIKDDELLRRLREL